MKSFDNIENHKFAIESKMHELLKEHAYNDANLQSKIYDSMFYCITNGGKRVRPLLTLNFGLLLKANIEDCINVGIAIEFIHTYSLIHDDLPAIDNDNFRRGKPSCHKQFDEATAILTGDAFLTMAFEIIACHISSRDAKIICELITLIAKSAGIKGMISGQALDITQSSKMNKKLYEQINSLKTGMLFIASCSAAGIIADANKNTRQLIEEYGRNIGSSFQIADDISDKDSGTIDMIQQKEEHTHMLSRCIEIAKEIGACEGNYLIKLCRDIESIVQDTKIQ